MRTLLTALFITISCTLSAQSDSLYQSDLESLYAILQKTPSFRDQIRGDKKISYRILLNKLKKDTVHNPSDTRYFLHLAKLFFPIRDNHLSFYQTDRMPGEPEFPVYKGSLDSLVAILRKQPLDSIEGIYHYGDYFSAGLYKTSVNELEAVVVESAIPEWKKGQIAFYLYEQSPGMYRAVYRHPKYKNLIYSPVEKFINHSLVNSWFYSSFTEKVYTKDPNSAKFEDLPKNDFPYLLKSVRPEIQYLKLRNFSADQKSMRQSDAFFDSIKNSLTAKSLILDLRNNEGGAFKVSRKFHQLLKKYAARGKIYVLVNNGTMSQGEIFTLQLKKLKQVSILGQTTRGALAYGSNYGKRVKLPGKCFEVYITDMGGGKNRLAYEDYGVKPDILLRYDSDWIEQAIEIAEKE